MFGEATGGTCCFRVFAGAFFPWSRDMWIFHDFQGTIKRRSTFQGTIKRSGTEKAKPRGRCAVPWGRTERGRRPGACGTTFPHSVDPEIVGAAFYQPPRPCRRENDFPTGPLRRTSLPRGSQSGPRAPSASGAIRGPRPQAAAHLNRLSLHYSYYR